ncbi:MAG: exopolysaccharide biosynthesis polyprenyl glycosylphosphotransferase [Candidatus Zambryskibacteria bacterium]|nr:exopolysaccharide biosynthesis polyprenyl glycosylphosphotransferase [Candidatus Zambryskibacteria bacterium]
MDSVYKKESIILLLGDLVAFLVSLWIALLLRNLEIPSAKLFSLHLLPFSLLFAAWVVVFYIAGLYEKHTSILKSKLPNILANTQIVNSGIVIAFFYLIPFFGITPKTILFIYLIVSFALILSWRMYGYFILGRRRQNAALLIGSGEEMKELFEEVNNNPIYNIKFISAVDLNRADEQGFWDEIVSRVYSEGVSVIAIDLANKNVEPVLPHLYNLIFSKISFIDMNKIYEDIFDRVPISLLKYNWFLENISSEPRGMYDTLKRIMDILISIPLLIILAAFIPFIVIAIKLEDGGPLFIKQERIGQNNKNISIYKLRSMARNELDPTKKSDNVVTKAGAFLRKTRIDEFPQLWNVLKGDVSLIGPRPELPEAVKHYTEEVPYYNVRHLVRPGLSGWAQIYGEHPHHGVDVSKTKNKLSYDLYYIKNRSFLLDLKIALRTVKTLASIAGR